MCKWSCVQCYDWTMSLHSWLEWNKLRWRYILLFMRWPCFWQFWYCCTELKKLLACTTSDSSHTPTGKPAVRLLTVILFYKKLMVPHPLSWDPLWLFQNVLQVHLVRTARECATVRTASVARWMDRAHARQVSVERTARIVSAYLEACLKPSLGNLLYSCIFFFSLSLHWFWV